MHAAKFIRRELSLDLSNKSMSFVICSALMKIILIPDVADVFEKPMTNQLCS